MNRTQQAKARQRAHMKEAERLLEIRAFFKECAPLTKGHVRTEGKKSRKEYREAGYQHGSRLADAPFHTGKTWLVRRKPAKLSLR